MSARSDGLHAKLSNDLLDCPTTLCHETLKRVAAPQELDNLTKTYIVRECLRLLGISPDDLELLFSLLDENGDGQIAISKFFRAVLRLRGDATASDLYKLHLDLTRGVTRTTSLLKGLDSTNDVLARLIDVASCMDFEVVKGEKDVHDEVLFWKRQRAALDPAQQDADERHHHLLVRFGVEEEDAWITKCCPPQLLSAEASIRFLIVPFLVLSSHQDVSVDDALLALTDKPHKQYGAHAKKLMHASLRDGVTHAPDSTDRLASAPSRIAGGMSRTTVQTNSRQTLYSRLTLYQLSQRPTRVSEGLLAWASCQGQVSLLGGFFTLKIEAAFTNPTCPQEEAQHVDSIHEGITGENKEPYQARHDPHGLCKSRPPDPGAWKIPHDAWDFSWPKKWSW
eukprot:4327793-Amphidinium_carterae.1